MDWWISQCIIQCADSFTTDFIDESVETLQPGDFIEDTKPALVLEELIGQFLFSQGSGD